MKPEYLLSGLILCGCYYHQLHYLRDSWRRDFLIAKLDFTEIWAPVVRIESVRVLLALAALFDLWIIHIDAKTAFLNGNNDVELYVRQPEGFVDKRYPNHVL